MLLKLLKSWPLSKRKRWQAEGFEAYIICALGLSSAWMRLITTRKVWRNAFCILFSCLPRSWKDCGLCKFNRAVDALAKDIVVVNEKSQLVVRYSHHVHINLAEVMAILAVAIKAPYKAVIWIDSVIVYFWIQQASGTAIVSSLISDSSS